MNLFIAAMTVDKWSTKSRSILRMRCDITCGLLQSVIEQLALMMVKYTNDTSKTAFAQSDQNLHCVHFEEPRMQSFIIRTMKILIRLRECAG